MRQRDKLSQDESLAPFMWMDNAPSLYIKKTFFYLDLLERGHVEGYFYSLFVGNSTVLPPLFRCCWHVLICCNFADVASTMESDKGTSGRPDWTDNNM